MKIVIPGFETTPLFQRVSKAFFDSYITSYADDLYDINVDEDRRHECHLTGQPKFTRTMVAYREGKQFFVLNDLGEKTLGDPFPLLGDE